MISKDYLLSQIRKMHDCIEHDSCEYINCEYFTKGYVLQDIIEYLGHSETIIRCKDCKWYDKGSNEVDSWANCRIITGQHSVYDDFYCGNAERKKVEE